MTRPALIAVHGVCAGIARPSWTASLSHWLWAKGSSFEMMQRHYVAGPVPLWNAVFKNRYVAHQIAREVRSFAEDGAQIHFVAHSNGAAIVMRVIRLLADAGIRTAAAILLSGAISCDVRRSGVLELVRRGHLGRVIAYCTPADAVLNAPGFLLWPNGRLGRLGWRCDGQVYRSHAIYTRWFAGGHSEYFAPAMQDRTFLQILEDLNPVPF